jgi:hypothetical protein
LSGASFRFAYSPHREGLAFLQLTVDATEASLAGEELMLILSGNLTPVKTGHDDNRFGYDLTNSFRFQLQDFDGYKYVYRFMGNERQVILEEFSGDLFGNSQAGISFDLAIYGHGGLSAPVDVTVQGLSSADLYNAYPEPKPVAEGLLRYHFDSLHSPGRPEIGIHLRALDVAVVQSAQFRLFLLGAGFALAASVIVNVLTDFAAYSSGQIPHSRGNRPGD